MTMWRARCPHFEARHGAEGIGGVFPCAQCGVLKWERWTVVEERGAYVGRAEGEVTYWVHGCTAALMPEHRSDRSRRLFGSAEEGREYLIALHRHDTRPIRVVRIVRRVMRRVKA